MRGAWRRRRAGGGQPTRRSGAGQTRIAGGWRRRGTRTGRGRWRPWERQQEEEDGGKRVSEGVALPGGWGRTSKRWLVSRGTGGGSEARTGGCAVRRGEAASRAVAMLAIRRKGVETELLLVAVVGVGVGGDRDVAAEVNAVVVVAVDWHRVTARAVVATRVRPQLRSRGKTFPLCHPLPRRPRRTTRRRRRPRKALPMAPLGSRSHSSRRPASRSRRWHHCRPPSGAGTRRWRPSTPGPKPKPTRGRRTELDRLHPLTLARSRARSGDCLSRTLYRLISRHQCFSFPLSYWTPRWGTASQFSCSRPAIWPCLK
ncbi:hypothetical protein VTK73DRAFT_5629 [Phialemonium thermophilum]|uniref:Uncharacterized protein n=1 Tax=Phialemonium thermophilum TaxID=223376 RepID=A0ABR3V167_9PEZI